jgi:hypothetical protein
MLEKMHAKSGAVQRQLMQELELEQHDQGDGLFLAVFRRPSLQRYRRVKTFLPRINGWLQMRWKGLKHTVPLSPTFVTREHGEIQ